MIKPYHTNVLNRGVEHTQCYVSAVHNYKNMKLR